MTTAPAGATDQDIGRCDCNGAPSNADGYGFSVCGLAYGAGPVAKDIEGHKGGVDCQVDWQLSWFGGCFPDQG